MNEPDPQLDALFASARARRPDTSRAEFAFETRLLARLREKRPDASVWATVSWRLMPFFAVCLVALTLWHSEMVTQTEAAEQLVYVENPNAFEGWNPSFDL